ncbi:hypothetical protein [Hoeflea poritis]|uniref:Uncharacterized protein n=1 Tax=Hoeflea poritis TaxID=2993659 RepID=A0ABT4VIE7_9HYPH|nr:hypothetical protein [Hoeflea poritis]MDA4843960.1 hypothetical protein [Hoeflea poritis]
MTKRDVNARWALFALFLPLIGYMLSIGSALSQEHNPILAAPLPVCGLDNKAFEGLIEQLELNRVWRGRHENGEGALELTTNRKGQWLLLYRSMDSQDRKLVCVVARGSDSREWFGRPV